VLQSRPCSSRLYLPTGGQSDSVYSVRSARIFAYGFLQPAFGESLPSATLRHYLPVTGLALCVYLASLIRLTRFQGLVRSRSAPASSRASPAHNKTHGRLQINRADAVDLSVMRDVGLTQILAYLSILYKYLTVYVRCGIDECRNENRPFGWGDSTAVGSVVQSAASGSGQSASRDGGTGIVPDGVTGRSSRAVRPV